MLWICHHVLMQECRECLGVAQSCIIIALEENVTENVPCCQWMSNYFSNLETLQKSNNGFINEFCDT